MISRPLAAAAAALVLAHAARGLPAASALAEGEEPRWAEERLVLRTDFGDIVVALYPEIAPKTVEQVLALARAGVYDGTRFHKADPRFLLQVANPRDRRPLLTDAQLALLRPIPDEFSATRHRRGVLSMSHGREPGSGEASFSILLVPAPHLDGKYTVFGRVVAGDRVLDSLAAVPKDAESRPFERLAIRAIEVVAQKDMGTVTLKPAKRVVRPAAPPPAKAEPAEGAAKPSPEKPSPWIAGFLGVAGALGVAVFLGAGRLSARTLASLGLLIVLVGFLGAFTVLVPAAAGRPWLGVVLFASAIGIFKLMNRMETPR